MVYRSLFLYFNDFVTVPAGGPENPRGAHVAKRCGRLWLIRSVLRASKLSVLTLIEIVILRLFYTIPFGFNMFRHFLGITFQFSTTFCGQGSLTRVKYLKSAYNLIGLKMTHTSLKKSLSYN